MKIYFGNANYHPRVTEGAKIHITSVVRGLQDLKVDVTVNPQSPAPNVSRARQGRLSALLDLLDRDLIYLRMDGRIPAEQLPVSIPSIRRRFGIPVVWEINAVAGMTGGPDDPFEIPSPDVLRRTFGQAASAVDGAICNTEGLATFARDIGISRVKKISLAADPAAFRPETETLPIVQELRRKFNVVWMGSSSIRWHDFPTMMRAAERLLPIKDIRFFVIGGEPTVAYPGNVFWIGQRKHEEIPRILSGMDVGLAIYRRPSDNRYGVFTSPLKIFDYMACGLPVIASPIEQARECICQGENGFLVDFGDDLALASRLESLLGQGDCRRRYGPAGRARIETYYHWGRVARESLEFLEEVRRSVNLRHRPASYLFRAAYGAAGRLRSLLRGCDGQPRTPMSASRPSPG